MSRRLTTPLLFLLEWLIQRVFQKLPGSRASVFAQLDAPALQPLIKLLAAFALEDDKIARAAMAIYYETRASPAEDARMAALVFDVLVMLVAPAAPPPRFGQATPVALTPVPVIGSQGNIAEQRDQIRAYIGQAKEWLEQQEPNSPVPC